MTFLDLQLRICVIGHVLLVLVLVKQLLSFQKLRHRSHFALHLKQPRRFSGARCCSRGVLLRISLIFLVLRKAGMMDPTGKIFLRDGRTYINDRYHSIATMGQITFIFTVLGPSLNVPI